MNNDWTLTTEGISPGWAFFLLLILGAGAAWAYVNFAPDVPAWRRIVMTSLRIAAIAVLLVLLAKPVLNFTINETVRQSLPVLVDVSQSLAVSDRRDRPDDVVRAAIATGLVAADAGLKTTLPGGAEQLASVSRWDLLKKLATNEKLNLWVRLGRVSDLAFYPFAREASSATRSQDASTFFQSAHPDQPATAIGDSLRQVIDECRSQPAAGILLITDGQNNAGSLPLEAAQMARDQNLPLFIYGVGVTAAPDVILEEVRTQKLAFARERVEVRAKIRVQGLRDKTVSATLRVNGEEADTQTLATGDEGEYEVALHFVPQGPGNDVVQVSLAPLLEETAKDNNTASAKLRVTDEKFHVLLIEQEPRWDFRYLLAYLERDRRLDVRCVMIDGEPGLDKDADSPFLPGLPDDRGTFFNSQVLILGDVNPDDLGEERMGIIRDWVEAGGGIIFLAGQNFNPSSYAGTSLEPLLPVIPDTDPSADPRARSLEPFKLQLTVAGDASSYLQMAPDPEENQRIWEEFPGVRWTAAVSRVKPGAEALLVDPRPERSGRYGAPPVFAMQGYGAGTCVFFGTDETYRWRSKTGEKYYSILWGQIMQSLALQLLEGGSSRTQLRTDRPQYTAGDKVVISGKAYTDSFEPLLQPTLEGTLTFTTTDANGRTTEKKQPLNLSAIPETQGFRGEFLAKTPGEYTFSTQRDPETSLKFEVTEPRLEKTQTSLNERLLKAMAETSGGRFLREEDLDQLPRLLQEKSATVATFKEVKLYHSAWWLLALITPISLEWLLRRLTQLK